MRLVSLVFVDSSKFEDLPALIVDCEGQRIKFGKWSRYEPGGDWVLSFEAPVVTVGDSVDHPAHYNQHPSGVECIDVIEHMPANIAFAIKHLWRCDEKHPDPMEDLRKAEWYVRREMQRRRRMLEVAP